MGTVSTTLPSDGQTIDASDVNTPINAILNEFNGNIDNDNIKSAANINGSKLADDSISGGKFDATTQGGWIASALPSVSSVTNNGQRSYDITFGSTVASLLTPGMRLRTTRTVTAPTQCTDLESGSSQYWNDTSLTGVTFTDDFVCSAWIKLESYGSQMAIASRYNGTSGWRWSVESDGRISLTGFNAGAANFSQVLSYQSVPLGRWVHVASQLDMSAFTATDTTSYIMIDGVNVPATVTRGGTNPTALVQAGNLEIGATNSGTTPFDGKLAQVAIFSAKVTQATMRGYMSQGLSGSETNLVSAYSFNGNANDLNTTNANNLSAQGSATATNADSPFSLDANGTPGGTYDYAIVTRVNAAVATVQVPEGCTIPTSGGVSTVDLSPHKAPFGMPVQKTRWVVELLIKAQFAQSSPVQDTWYNLTTASGTTGGAVITAPTGDWSASYEAAPFLNRASGAANQQVALSTANNTASEVNTVTEMGIAAVTDQGTLLARYNIPISVSSATSYYLNTRTISAGITTMYLLNDRVPAIVRLEPAHL